MGAGKGRTRRTQTVANKAIVPGKRSSVVERIRLYLNGGANANTNNNSWVDTEDPVVLASLEKLFADAEQGNITDSELARGILKLLPFLFPNDTVRS